MPKIITCKQCGQSGFTWYRGEFGRFYLADSNGTRHECPNRKRFLANKDAICPSCDKPIRSGVDYVSWARRGPDAGNVYHEWCKNSDEAAMRKLASYAPVSPIQKTDIQKTDIPSICRHCGMITCVCQPADSPSTASKEMTMQDNLAAILAQSIQPYISKHSRLK